MKDKTNTINNALLALTSKAIFGVSACLPEDMDWAALLNEARKQHVVSLVYPAIFSATDPPVCLADISDEDRKNWSGARDSILANNARNLRCHFAIHRILSETSTPYVILKGLASGCYYPDPLSRTYGDVDFYIDKKNLDNANELLLSRGFVYDHEHDKHKVYWHKGTIYELHTGIVGVPYGSPKKAFDDFFADLISCSGPFELDGSVCTIPSPKHHAVIMLLHMISHLRSDGIGLRHLCDWAVFVDRMPAEFFSEELRPVLKKLGIWRFATIITDLCTDKLGLRECSWAGSTDERYLDLLMDDIMSSGDFGSLRSPSDTIDRRFAFYRAGHGDQGALRAFLNMMNDGARASFPQAATKPVLLPVGWISAGAKFMAKAIKGNRSLSDISHLSKNNSHHKQLFDEWELFAKDSEEE